MGSVADRISVLVSEATEGAVTPDRTTPLSELGVDSLGWLRLLDALEDAFDVEVELGPAELRTATVDRLADSIEQLKRLTADPQDDVAGFGVGG